MKKTFAALTTCAALAASLIAGSAIPAQAAAKKDIVMTISSSTHSRADVNWYSNFNSATLENHATPYVKKVTTAGYSHSISASNFDDDYVVLTCTIAYKGRVVRKHTVRGKYVHVNCSFTK